MSLASRWGPAGDRVRGLTVLLSCLRLEKEFDRAGLGIAETFVGACVRFALTRSLFSRRRPPFFRISFASLEVPVSCLTSTAFFGAVKLALRFGRTSCFVEP